MNSLPLFHQTVKQLIMRQYYRDNPIAIEQIAFSLITTGGFLFQKILVINKGNVLNEDIRHQLALEILYMINLNLDLELQKIKIEYSNEEFNWHITLPSFAAVIEFGKRNLGEFHLLEKEVLSQPRKEIIKILKDHEIFLMELKGNCYVLTYLAESN